MPCGVGQRQPRLTCQVELATILYMTTAALPAYLNLADLPNLTDAEVADRLTQAHTAWRHAHLNRMRDTATDAKQAVRELEAETRRRARIAA